MVICGCNESVMYLVLSMGLLYLRIEKRCFLLFLFQKIFLGAQKFPQDGASLLETICWSIYFEFCAYLNQQLFDVCIWNYWQIKNGNVIENIVQWFWFWFLNGTLTKVFDRVVLLSWNAHFMLFCFLYKSIFLAKNKELSICVCVCVCVL